MTQIQKRWAVVAAITTALALPAAGQFSSGSTGSDGALNLTTAGTIDFDPAARGLNPAGDNIFNFTTINIGAGVTVRLKASRVREKSVVWLASGAVTIAGTIDLTGADGAAMSSANPALTRLPAEPGAGGYSGGLGVSGSSPNTSGFGPGGGAAIGNQQHGAGGGYATPGGGAGGGNIYGSVQLVPLVGGSGGAGSGYTGSVSGNGGAGGGALRVISSVSIALTGSILAKGGSGGAAVQFSGTGGCASGGAIHLVAPAISGTGAIDASGGASGCAYVGGLGRILLSSDAISFSGSTTGASTVSRLYLPPLNPAGVPSVRVTSVNGIATPANPTGDRFVPDVTISVVVAVTVAIAASNIPTGTVVNLALTPENGADQSIACTPLAGTVASSTATCSASFPSGISITAARAIW